MPSSIFWLSPRYGAGGGTRTRDLLITNQMHYRLCYASMAIIYHILKKIQIFLLNLIFKYVKILQKGEIMLYQENDFYADASISSADGRQFVVEYAKHDKSVIFKVLPRPQAIKEDDRLVFDEGTKEYEIVLNFAKTFVATSYGESVVRNEGAPNYMMCLKHPHFVEIVFINSKRDAQQQNFVKTQITYRNLGLEKAVKNLINDVKNITEKQNSLSK